MSHTAGKGPGLVLRAANHSGAFKVALSRAGDRALVEVLEAGGGAVAEIGLNAEELQQLAHALQRVRLALLAQSLDEPTHP